MSQALEHNLEVNDRRTLTEAVRGRVTISSGGNLELTGSCDELIVESEGHATVRGTVRGDAVNRGGLLILEPGSVVSGRLVEEAGETRVETGAQVSSIGPDPL